MERFGEGRKCNFLIYLFIKKCISLRNKKLAAMLPSVSMLLIDSQALQQTDFSAVLEKIACRLLQRMF